MKKIYFQVTLKSDIVLPATSNNEGCIEQLDFIAGSNFLGMVAKEYDSFTNPFDIFHSSKVRFGDATIMHDNQPTYKVPLSFFYEKLKKNQNINQLTSPLSQFHQAKQHRKGYITEDLKWIDIEYSYAQKSAYERTKRRSKDAQMYGYMAITKGSEWQFALHYDESIDADDLERIKKALKGKRRLGKSKSSQYGEVEISPIDAPSPIYQNLENTQELYLYAKSRLALVDSEGYPTLDLQYLCEGLDEEQIDYKRTQIRTSSFTPYNGAMQTKSYERTFIANGSVIVLQNISDTQLQALQRGVGAHLSEGFGEVLINPSFLAQVGVFNFINSTTQITPTNQRKKIKAPFSNCTVQFLANRHNQEIERLDIANEVAEFIAQHAKLYSQKMNAQWGTIRSLSASNSDESIVGAIEEYISNGVAAQKWKGEKKAKLLEAVGKSSNRLAFVKLLAMQMPKHKEAQHD